MIMMNKMNHEKTKIINNVFVKKHNLILGILIISSIVLIMYYNMDFAYDRVENLGKIAELPKLQELQELSFILPRGWMECSMIL